MNGKRKYQPWNAKAQSWDFIENRYKEDWQGEHKNLLELVRHIKNSDLNERLFGSTSMDKLVISIYDPIDYRQEALHITFDLWSRKWHFEYVAAPFRESEFVRTYDEEKGIEKFDQFVNLIRW